MNECILGTMHIIQILLAIDSVLIYFCIPYRTSYHSEKYRYTIWHSISIWDGLLFAWFAICKVIASFNYERSLSASMCLLSNGFISIHIKRAIFLRLTATTSH